MGGAGSRPPSWAAADRAGAESAAESVSVDEDAVLADFIDRVARGECGGGGRGGGRPGEGPPFSAAAAVRFARDTMGPAAAAHVELSLRRSDGGGAAEAARVLWLDYDRINGRAGREDVAAALALLLPWCAERGGVRSGLEALFPSAAAAAEAADWVERTASPIWAIAREDDLAEAVGSWRLAAARARKPDPATRAAGPRRTDRERDVFVLAAETQAAVAARTVALIWGEP